MRRAVDLTRSVIRLRPVIALAGGTARPAPPDHERATMTNKTSLKGFIEAVGAFGAALPDDLRHSFSVALSELQSEIEHDRDRYWRSMDRLRTACEAVSAFESKAEKGQS